MSTTAERVDPNTDGARSDSALRPADHLCDVLVVGGGINGVGIARDLAGRGWRVVLCEQDDLASHASSASTKLTEVGWLRLARGEFARMRQALAEREVLLRSAPHIAWPMRLVMPHDPAARPAWQVRLGLHLSDQLAGQGLALGPGFLNLRESPLGEGLQPAWQQAFVYSDAWVDDARLVALCALDAADRGAQILTRTRCVGLRVDGAGWRAELSRRDAFSGQEARRLSVQARAVVNAAGPWAEHVSRGLMQMPPQAGRRLVKSSHIVVPRLFRHDHGYRFQGRDGRDLFAIPFERQFTLIGPTEVGFTGDPGHPTVDDSEVDHLCKAVSRHLRRPITHEDVVWSFAGVRPAPDDTREPMWQPHLRPAPWLTAWGGRLATFRSRAQQAADQVGALLGEARSPWTESAFLPGGDLSELVDEATDPEADMAAFQHRLRQRHPWIGLPLLRRWTRAYGSRVLRLLDGVSSRGDLGAEIAPDLHEAELFFLKCNEWALTGEDVLWRRSKLGLHASAEQREAVSAWLAAQAQGAASGFHSSELSRHQRA